MSKITFSADQQQAIRDFKEWWDAGCPHGLAKLIAPAGSGKTTIADEMAKAVGAGVVWGAPTGKAASVLARKTKKPVMSVHQMIRHPVGETENGGPIFTRKRWEGGSQALLTIDEASMVDFDLAKDILTFQAPGQPPDTFTPVLALGDDFQLPPVSVDKWSLLDCRKNGPTFRLDTIHRNGGGVLELATRIRTTPGIESVETIGDGSEARVKDDTLERMMPGNAIATYVRKGVKFLTRYRKTAAQINDMARASLGFTEPDWQVGDTVMVLNNNWDLNVMNGQEFVVFDRSLVRPERGNDPAVYRVHLVSVDDGTARFLPSAMAYRERMRPEVGDVMLAPSYALTTHKAQGSEWDRVFVINEHDWRSDLLMRRRWLYTAVTRAKKQVFVLGSKV